MRYKALRLRMSGALPLPVLDAFILCCYNFSFTSYRVSEYITSGSICAMAKVISHEPVARGTWVRSQAVCAIKVAQVALGQGFLQECQLFPVITTPLLHAHPFIYHQSYIILALGSVGK